MRTTIVALSVLVSVAASSVTGAEARARHGNGDDKPYGGGVPYLDVKTSCSDAQKFSSGSGDKNAAFNGCMQDENNAKSVLAKRWSGFKSKDKQDCVEQSRHPSPSYVEVLTCLEMDSGSMQNTSAGGKPMPPQIGGPVAPGLTGATPGGVPGSTGVPRT